MSNEAPEKVSEPLMEEAFVGFNPTNQDLFRELRRQNKGINKAVSLGEKTNGRVTKLEAKVEPMWITYEQYKKLLWITILVAPWIVSIGTRILGFVTDYAIKHINLFH